MCSSRRWCSGLALGVLCLLQVLQQAAARFVIEQGGLKIKFPIGARDQHREGFDMSLANFGAPEYGGELVGKLTYIDKAHGTDAVCHPECRYACQPFDQAQPIVQLRKGDQNYIMLVDRGPVSYDVPACKFAEKVFNAQQAGASAVLVVNYEDALTTMEAPDEDDESFKYHRNITIPAAFITKSSGDALKKLLTTAAGEDAPEVVAVMDWNDVLPRAEKVKWEFWSNSNDQCGAVCDVQKEFIKEFKPVAKELERGNWTAFEPHYIVWICPSIYRDSDECQSQCIRRGRYCTPDPDGDLDGGYSGADVVQENLRQLCIWKLANQSGEPWHWWEYVTQFGEQCRMGDENYNDECAVKVFKQVGGQQWSSVDALHECVGDIQDDSANDMMEAEKRSQRGSGSVGEVFILPTIRINNGQYRGKLGYVDVLKAICAGFHHGMEPTVCNKFTSTNCRPGSEGDNACRARIDGKTRCQDVIADPGYECVCGDGYVTHANEDGSQTCLQVNQCASRQAMDDPQCNCERCACHESSGGYQCLQDLEDRCKVDNGGCWQTETRVQGQTRHFSACLDNIKAYKANAAQGRPLNETSLSKCVCPPCFFELKEGNQTSCMPKGNLDYCNLESGAYDAEPGAAGGGMAGWAVALIVFGAVGTVAAGGYAVYRLRIRSAMHQEIKSIMAQYMPLGEEGDRVERDGLTSSNANNGGV